jgi:hypothetical protein
MSVHKRAVLEGHAYFLALLVVFSSPPTCCPSPYGDILTAKELKKVDLG